MKRIDLTNQKYGKLLVLKYDHSDKNGKPYYECLCDCGNKIIARGENIRSGRSKSCGCYTIERSKEANTKHGDSGSRLYNEWLGIRKRCNDKNNKEYKNYGNRGINVCKEWNSDYLCFKEWAVNNGYSDNLTIERIDVNEGYNPNNCTWIPMPEQSINKRIQKNNTTGIKGVTLKNGKYIVRISYKGKRYYIGPYKTPEEAMAKRKEAEENLWR